MTHLRWAIKNLQPGKLKWYRQYTVKRGLSVVEYLKRLFLPYFFIGQHRCSQDYLLYKAAKPCSSGIILATVPILGSYRQLIFIAYYSLIFLWHKIHLYLVSEKDRKDIFVRTVRTLMAITSSSIEGGKRHIYIVQLLR